MTDYDKIMNKINEKVMICIDPVPKNDLTDKFIRVKDLKDILEEYFTGGNRND